MHGYRSKRIKKCKVDFVIILILIQFDAINIAVDIILKRLNDITEFMFTMIFNH